MSPFTLEQVWDLLDQVNDPEIPVVSLVDMGIVRDVQIDGENVHVTLTPTFSGCPALQVMADEVKMRLREAGAQKVEVVFTNEPPWSSDSISPSARQKLKDFGISPPANYGGQVDLVQLEIAACPYCDSEDTTLKNPFGSTLCRTIHYCNSCQQPFERFKPL